VPRPIAMKYTARKESFKKTARARGVAVGIVIISDRIERKASGVGRRSSCAGKPC